MNNTIDYFHMIKEGNPVFYMSHLISQLQWKHTGRAIPDNEDHDQESPKEEFH